MARSEVDSFLDGVCNAIEAGDGIGAISDLISGLDATRSRVSTDEWRVVVEQCRNHPLFDVLQEDPYTKRAYTKPRGYAGDAVMMDYVYSGRCPPGASELGQTVFDGTTRTSNGLSVLHRRELLAETIDREAHDNRRPRILALACGHLRELERARCYREGRAELIAVDQDPASLEVVRTEYGHANVETRQDSVKRILTEGLGLEDLDLIYAAGLYDYLGDEAAAALCARSWSALKPGGRLLVGNFAPDSHGRVYMEVFMDWILMYRDEKKLKAVVQRISDGDIASQQVTRDPHGNVVYLEMQKRMR